MLITLTKETIGKLIRQWLQENLAGVLPGNTSTLSLITFQWHNTMIGCVTHFRVMHMSLGHCCFLC